MSIPQEQTLDEVAPSSVDAPARAPVLFVVLEAERPLSGGARHSLAGVERITIGRGDAREALRSEGGRAIELRVPGRWISARHATIRAVDGEWIVEDTGSRNGTFVNGQRITTALLREGDVLQAGRVFFMVRGAPSTLAACEEPIAASVRAPFGLRTLLPELEAGYASLVRVAGGSQIPILLLGPTGSGKEVLAREAHARSRRHGDFVPVNCGALPPLLVESLLFGHVKGAFSGATRDEPGLVRSAHGGTLFLDEIGDLPPSSQAALLRVLQEQEVVAVGATRPARVDVRVVAATHKPLEALTASGAFRADLLARLKGYTHRLLPLRMRMPDLGVLLADVLDRVAGARAVELVLEPEAALALLTYAWPYNIRELYHAVASALVLGPGNVLEARHLPSDVLREAGEPPVPDEPSADDVVLRERVIALLREHRGNLTAVARAMGKGPTQIYRWVRRFQLPLDVYRRS
jgi:transcriptional regulator of acetoin/glycerol metabolism